MMSAIQQMVPWYPCDNHVAGSLSPFPGATSKSNRWDSTKCSRFEIPPYPRNSKSAIHGRISWRIKASFNGRTNSWVSSFENRLAKSVPKIE